MIKPGAEALMAMALLSELDHRMGLEAGEFLIGAGERIGEACVPPRHTDVPRLAVWMNDIWSGLGLGQVILTTGPRQLAIRHRLPTAPAEAVLWRKALPYLIEGIYRAWLLALDPKGNLTLTQASENELDFIYAD